LNFNVVSSLFPFGWTMAGLICRKVRWRFGGKTEFKEVVTWLPSA
jgi:hypothetical protein